MGARAPKRGSGGQAFFWGDVSRSRAPRAGVGSGLRPCLPVDWARGQPLSGHGAPAGVDFELVMGWWHRECGARQFAACPDSARCSPPQSRPDTCSGNSVRKVGEGGVVSSPLEP